MFTVSQNSSLQSSRYILLQINLILLLNNKNCTVFLNYLFNLTAMIDINIIAFYCPTLSPAISFTTCYLVSCLECKILGAVFLFFPVAYWHNIYRLSIYLSDKQCSTFIIRWARYCLQ